MKKIIPFIMGIIIFLGIISFTTDKSWDGIYFCTFDSADMARTVDANAEGQSSVNALGGGNDNDGAVKFTSLGIKDSTIKVELAASLTDFLNVGVDFTNDSSGKNHGEQRFKYIALVPALNHRSFFGPSEATACPTFARFRFSAESGFIPGCDRAKRKVENKFLDIQIPVELNAFEATSGNGIAHLEWIAGLESKNMGFHVYRSLTELVEYEQITRGLIVGAGNSTTAHTYRYIDRDVIVGYTYYYKLSNMDLNCNINYYGPISVTISGFPISGEKKAIPVNSSLAQNHYNPINPETEITSPLKKTDQVGLKGFDIRGRLVPGSEFRKSQRVDIH